ncbi:hypothetical protein CDD81_2199 [Ophiocordyceps australis]|uniref:Protein BIG1 n=1 Tax=Ophiocordyceps australis TaxID=1399860 RepID=A0A2C5XZI7_9HYPO|nr:hypothetical protein CDD81_2199 [Ophiocordyceps australis]
MKHLQFVAATLSSSASLLCLASSAVATATIRDVIRDTDITLGATDVLLTPYASPINPPALLVRRQATTPSRNNGGSPVTLNPNKGLNITAWDRETTDACMKALSSLTRSSNPSGNCVCYNVPSLDTQSGVFEADLRLFRVSDPRDGFAGVAPADINVAVQFSGASVSPVSPEDLMAMDMAPTKKTKQSLMTRAETHQPQLLRTYMFVGQIDAEKMKTNMSMAELEAVLMPTFTLTAKNLNGGAISTNVSLNEAAFLQGVFSKQVVMSSFGSAQAAVDAKLDALHNGTVAFVLPGVQIMIFPIGTIITSVWLLLGLTAYGYGTWQRIMYADMYKRQQAVVGAPGKMTF